MTSNTTVLESYSLVNGKRTESKHCTSSEHLGDSLDVEIAVQDVVRHYLRELMRHRLSKKTDLAKGMATSRAQLQASIKDGRMTVDQMNALASTLGSSPSAILRELATIAEKLEKGKLRPLTGAEIEEMLRRGPKSPGAAVEEPTLELDVDRQRFSEDTAGELDDGRPHEQSGRGGRQPRTPRSPDPHPRRQR